ncbi:hypothetical protein M426DRAFT_8288 [Hypoxylon sp. CI-4A]|nr:hypothetical protein M426DRAFT_8288 [Hypoxylon sp. CI-4A]
MESQPQPQPQPQPDPLPALKNLTLQPSQPGAAPAIPNQDFSHSTKCQVLVIKCRQGLRKRLAASPRADLDVSSTRLQAVCTMTLPRAPYQLALYMQRLHATARLDPDSSNDTFWTALADVAMLGVHAGTRVLPMQPWAVRFLRVGKLDFRPLPRSGRFLREEFAVGDFEYFGAGVVPMTAYAPLAWEWWERDGAWNEGGGGGGGGGGGRSRTRVKSQDENENKDGVEKKSNDEIKEDMDQDDQEKSEVKSEKENKENEEKEKKKEKENTKPKESVDMILMLEHPVTRIEGIRLPPVNGEVVYAHGDDDNPFRSLYMDPQEYERVRLIALDVLAPAEAARRRAEAGLDIVQVADPAVPAFAQGLRERRRTVHRKRAQLWVWQQIQLHNKRQIEKQNQNQTRPQNCAPEQQQQQHANPDPTITPLPAATNEELREFRDLTNQEWRRIRPRKALKQRNGGGMRAIRTRLMNRRIEILLDALIAELLGVENY